jgi:hypothetical protein
MARYASSRLNISTPTQPLEQLQSAASLDLLRCAVAHRACTSTLSPRTKVYGVPRCRQPRHGAGSSTQCPSGSSPGTASRCGCRHQNQGTCRQSRRSAMVNHKLLMRQQHSVMQSQAHVTYRWTAILTDSEHHSGNAIEARSYRLPLAVVLKP